MGAIWAKKSSLGEQKKKVLRGEDFKKPLETKSKTKRRKKRKTPENIAKSH